MTIQDFITGITRRGNDPKLIEAVKLLFDIVFQVLSHDGAKQTITYDEYGIFYNCRKVDASQLRASFERLDVDKNDAISREEFINGAVDFFVAKNEDGPGSLMFGTVAL